MHDHAFHQAGKQCRGQAHLSTTLQQQHAHDKEVFQTLLALHKSMERRVENLPNGIRSVTRSSDPTVVSLLHDHVPAMHRRILQGFALRKWDALYVELFKHTDELDMVIKLLPDGVEVLETSTNPAVVPLIQAHGETVSSFVERGFDAASNPSPMQPST